MVEFRSLRCAILGPTEVTGPDGDHTPTAEKPRTLLAALLLHANKVVPTPVLIEALWGQRPPRSAQSTLQVYISQLRKLLQPGLPVVTRTRGYSALVRVDQFDLLQFQQQAARGVAALNRGDPHTAVRELTAALELWRGPALADVVESPLMKAAAVRLEEERMAAVEQRIEAELQLGVTGELVSELQALAIENPLREDLHAKLMLALFRTGRKAEALEVFATFRSHLAEEFGVEPGTRLRETHVAVLTGEAQIPGPRTAAASIDGPVPHRSLPPPVSDLSGRDAELARLSQLLGTAHSSIAGAAVVVVTGLPGVGKSTLAIRAADELATSFPDRVLFARLTDPATAAPVPPAKAAGSLLRGCGLPEEELPAQLDARIDLLRHRLAGRGVLAVLDDVRSETQVRVLLEGVPGVAWLITSTRPLPGLECAVSVPLDVLEPADAAVLFTRAAGRPGLAASDPEVAAIVRWCGCLPLAVRVAAALLAAKPHWTTATLADRLRDPGTRLDELKVGDLDVRSRLERAYRECSDQSRRTFRMLGLRTGAEFDVWAAAAVLDLGEPEALDAIERLVDERVLAVCRPGAARAGSDGQPDALRYAFPAPLQLYARERLAAEEPPASQRQALDRLLSAYRQIGRSGDQTLWPGRPRTRDQDRAGPLDPRRVAQILGGAPARWFQAACPVLLDGVRRAHQAGMWQLCWTLADSMSGYLRLTAGWTEWEEGHTLALEAARRGGDAHAEAVFLLSLAELAWQRQADVEAVDLAKTALPRFSRAGDQQGAAYALLTLADVYLSGGGHEAAWAKLAIAHSIFTRGRDIWGMAETHRAMAVAHWIGGNLVGAAENFRACLRLVLRSPNPHWESYVLRNLRLLQSAPRTDWLEVRPGVWCPRPQATPLTNTG